MTQNSSPLPPLEKPRLVVEKSARKLLVYDGERLIETYPIGLGFAPDGDKEREGDGKTPEGEYYVFTKNEKSRFFLSLGLSYPSVDDARRGFAGNLITREEHDAILEAIEAGRVPPQKSALGGEIYIHGGGAADDWTRGCVALANDEMKALFEAIPVGTRVVIRP